MKWEERGSKIWRRGQGIGFSEVPQVDSYLWKESKWEDADKEAVGSYNWSEEKICAKEVEDIPTVKKREVNL